MDAKKRVKIAGIVALVNIFLVINVNKKAVRDIFQKLATGN